MTLVAVIITLLYVFIMLFLLYGYFQVPVFCGKNAAPKTHFSIVIPYRNEAENLPHLFASFLQLKYPTEMFEIIAVNDASEDTSEEMWEEFRKQHQEIKMKLLQNVRKSGSLKKDAIELAISEAEKEYILTTDADCEVPPDWLRNFNSIILDTKAAAVAAPVALKTEGSKMPFLKSFQALDLFSLQAAGIGGFGINIPFMCNGANFCYSKKAFLEVNGFAGNQYIGSGDDVFLLQKFKKEGVKTAFLKSRSSVVITRESTTWQELFFQRVRWASKTSAYKSFFSKSLGAVVFLMNLLVALYAPLVLFNIIPPALLLLPFLLKFNVDFLLIHAGAKFFGKEKLMKSYFLSSLFYPFFSSAVAIYSVFSGYSWKGRHFKK